MKQVKNRYTGAVLYEYEDGMSLRNALENATSKRADLSGANLRDADLSGANLSGANLRDANLRDANLRGADLRGAYLRGAYLGGAYLRGANLSGANLRDADLSGANLSDAGLSGAYLSGACLGDACLGDANLRDAYLRGDAKLIGPRPILQIGPIGSRSDFLVAYITDLGLRFDAGCQRQITREVFEARLNETHGDNDHAKEYRAALALVDAHAEIWSKK